MIKLNRKMSSVAEKGDCIYRNSQAAINSDGLITIRNFNDYNKDSDELIILSRAETQAIFQLMIVLKSQETDLPF